VGDALVVTGGFAIEGTAILAREKRGELAGFVPPADLDRAAELLHDPGISVVRPARLAVETGGVHALHDPTEGGLATGLWELARASGTGVAVDQKRLPLLPECRAICAHLGLDPLGLIASGCLVIAAEPDGAEAIVERLEAEGIVAVAVGRVVPAEEGCTLRMPDGSVRELPTFQRDEIARLFE
jgi:hydrogenase maturation factor